MISVTFPDGAQRQFAPGTSGLDIAKSISPSLAKRTVAMALDGVVVDLADPITRDAKIEFVGREDPRALELIRHDCAHVLAEAVQTLFPGTQVTIGPVIENGFYYDFHRETPFTPEDFEAIEKKMRELIARDAPFTKEVWSRDEAIAFFEKKGEAFKVELVGAIAADQDLKIYKQGDWLDLCRGPHMSSTGKIGTAFKLMKVAGAYWRGDSNRPMLSRIYGTAFAKQEDLDAYLRRIEEAERRDHRRLGREMDLFHFQEEGPGTIFWNTAWTKRQAPTTLGILCDSRKPLFAEFPTDDFGNWQWWYLVHRAQPMILDDLPTGLLPSVQVIDDWTTNHKLALAFEAHVGHGKIFVCSMDLENNLNNDPVRQQFRTSLLDYLASPHFQPKWSVDAATLQHLATPTLK